MFQRYQITVDTTTTSVTEHTTKNNISMKNLLPCSSSAGVKRFLSPASSSVARGALKKQLKFLPKDAFTIEPSEYKDNSSTVRDTTSPDDDHSPIATSLGKDHSIPERRNAAECLPCKKRMLASSKSQSSEVPLPSTIADALATTEVTDAIGDRTKRVLQPPVLQWKDVDKKDKVALMAALGKCSDRPDWLDEPLQLYEVNEYAVVPPHNKKKDKDEGTNCKFKTLGAACAAYLDRKHATAIVCELDDIEGKTFVWYTLRMGKDVLPCKDPNYAQIAMLPCTPTVV